MENISLSIINLRSNKENALSTKQVYLNIKPEFQRIYEAWDDKFKTRFIESILLNRATNPIWIVLNDAEDSEEILDGMHRIHTALAFFNNEFSIHPNYIQCLDKEKYGKKKYNDLDGDDKAKVRNYNFIFNKLDSSYRKDMNKLRDMYEILNRSSKTLTDYEFNKVILGPFYTIISRHKESFLKTNFFNTIKDSRGNVDSDIIEMLVLSYKLPSCWSSIANLTDEWLKKTIGDTTEGVEAFIKENEELVENKLKFMNKIIIDFYQKEGFTTNKQLFKKFCLPYKFAVSRCCFLIKDYSFFNRISNKLIEQFNKDIFIEDIQVRLGCHARNAIFQKKIIEKIDEIISLEVNQDGSKRLFSKKMILDKLEEQKHICPCCNLQIKDKDVYHGDHIISWTSGGKTQYDNLQVLHKRCHELKSA